MGYETLVDFSHWTFIAQICNLLIQVYLFKRFLFQPVKKILAKRQEEVDALEQSTNEANAKALQARSEYESHLSQAKQEAAEIRKSSKQQAQRQSETMLQQAKQEAARVKEKASSDIAREKKQAMNEIKDDISNIAMEIATKVVQKELTGQDQTALIEEFIGKLGDDA